MAEQESQPQETASAGGEEGSGAGGGGQEPKTPGLWSAGTKKTSETESALTGLVPVSLQPPEQGDASRAFSVGIARAGPLPLLHSAASALGCTRLGSGRPRQQSPPLPVVPRCTSGRKVPGLVFDPVDMGFWYPEWLLSEALPHAQDSIQFPPCSGSARRQASVPCSGVKPWEGELCPQTLVWALETSRPLVLRNTPYPPLNSPLSAREFPFGRALWPWPSHSCD